MKNVLPHGAHTGPAGHLVVGGCDTVELAERFGTPLIVLDRATFEANARAFASVLGPSHIFYAGKALCCVAVCELVDGLGLGLDVCSGGELATALAAGFPPERILFHGNNKSVEELERARDAGVGRVVVDSFDEIAAISRLAMSCKLLVRITPGVEAHTHEAVQTGQYDSKFGFVTIGGIALRAIDAARAISGCDLVGVHAHIGSQIFEPSAFELAAERLAELLATAREELGFSASELNIGGGFGVAETSAEVAPSPQASAEAVLAAVQAELAARGVPVPAVFLEPGRSIAGRAGVTVYKVGTVKRIPGVRTYLSVDGGMADNPRLALYGTRYDAFLANRMNAPSGELVTVAGKHCESGDLLVVDARMPGDVAPGDLLCIPATGAYTYSMASNYNRLPRPPVIIVHDGEATEVIVRESHADVLRLDRHLDGTPLRDRAAGIVSRRL
ncbi:MAG: diaminopimelate decarboxylase [Actinobacteria bacterium]|nr:diaminopimelate decarboxylase [Actinomycetota bacterium]